MMRSLSEMNWKNQMNGMAIYNRTNDHKIDYIRDNNMTETFYIMSPLGIFHFFLIAHSLSLHSSSFNF